MAVITTEASANVFLVLKAQINGLIALDIECCNVSVDSGGMNDVTRC